MYGDTAVGRKRVAQLREQGEDIRTAAANLVAQAEAVPWHGRAAEAMRTRIKERAAHLQEAAAGHDAAADSLSRHLAEVDLLKETIDERAHRAGLLISDARTRSAQAPAPEDQALLAFVAPPDGHKDWLTTELPGL